MKYYHIMPISSFFYNESIINMINDNSDKFNKDEHFFIVVNEEGYKKYKKTNNIIYDPSILGTSKINSLKKYIGKSDYTFLHSNYLKIFDLIRLEKKYLEKIVWGIWGHDLYDNPNLKGKISLYKKIKELLKKIIFNKIRILKVKQFYGVGIGFSYDAIEVRKKYGSIRILPLLYGYKKDLLKITDKILKDGTKKKNKPIKIMIGHSAFPFLNHIKILDDLKKYKDENIIISLPLNYGSMEYANSVEEYAVKIFGDKTEVVKEKMEMEEYLKFIKDVDICILDFEHQAALGNIFLLLKSGTKIYLNKNGILKLAMMLENIETYNVDQISNMSFEKFSEKIEQNKKSLSLANDYLDEKVAVSKFKSILSELEYNKFYK